MGSFSRRIAASVRISVMAVGLMFGPGGVTHAVQPDQPAQPDQSNKLYDLGEPIDWDVLPNGLLVAHYDQTGDGIPDQFTLHQIIWSGWTTQTVRELEAQAQVDRQWVFIVEYDQDRYVYFTRENPSFLGDDPQQNGQRTLAGSQ